MWLLDIIEEHPDAVAADFIRHGLRLRWLYDPSDDRVTIHDAYTLTRALYADRGSTLYRAVNPDEWYWGMSEWLLAEIADRLGIQIWQTGYDPKKRQPIPDPIERPGVEKPKPRNLLWDREDNAMGLDPGRVVDPRDWLGWEKTPLTTPTT